MLSGREGPAQEVPPTLSNWTGRPGFVQARPPEAVQGPPILTDLTFADPALEAAFQRQHRPPRALSAGTFAWFQCFVFVIVATRTLLAGDITTAVLFLLFALTGFVRLAAVAPNSGRLVNAAVMATDVLQTTMGGAHMHYISPSHEGMAPLASLAHVLHGSCALWPLLYALFSPLPFRMQLMNLAMVTIVLLGFSKRICACSAGLRQGYHTLACLLGKGRPHGWALACLRPTQLASVTLQACYRWQVGMLLLPGFVGGTWTAFRAERRLRLSFLHEARRGGMARNMPSDLDFLLNFALPATLAMWGYARDW